MNNQGASIDAWLSLYIYYHGKYDEILSTFIRPTIDALLSKNLASSFFFIRYSEDGDHIRLRLFAPICNHEKLRIEISISSDAYNCNVTDDASILNIKIVPYEPEVNRYGGRILMQVCEKIFAASSQTTLQGIAQIPNWNYSRALGTAIKMNVIMLYHFGFNKYDSIRFFNSFQHHWLSHTLKFRNCTGNSVTFSELNGEFLQKFEIQRSIIEPIIRKVWCTLETGKAFKEDWINHWIRALENITAEFCTKTNLPKIETPANYKPIGVELRDADLCKWGVLESLVHMNNNRLGILNFDEAYIAYLIKCSLELYS